jgi:hypothetical protein
VLAGSRYDPQQALGNRAIGRRDEHFGKVGGVESVDRVEERAVVDEFNVGE